MSTGADNKTMPGSAAYRDSYDRIFGKDKEPQRGRFVWDAEKHAFVPEGEYVAPATALTAPVLSGRFYENTVAIDGKTDIGSRRRYNEYLKQNDYCHAGDFSPQYIAKEKAQREAKDRAETRETVARLVYERWKP